MIGNRPSHPIFSSHLGRWFNSYVEIAAQAGARLGLLPGQRSGPEPAPTMNAVFLPVVNYEGFLGVLVCWSRDFSPEHEIWLYYWLPLPTTYPDLREDTVPRP